MEAPSRFENRPRVARRAQAPAGAQRAGGAPGLVTLKTSDTPAGDEIEIDAKAARMKRLQRSVKSAAQFFGISLGPHRFKAAMVTLTYRGVEDFCPRHISELLKRMRHWIWRRGHKLHYVWVGELQKRGALHYHVLVWLPRGLTLPKPDKQGWWPHGSTRIEWARNAVGYPESKRRIRWITPSEAIRLLNELPDHQRDTALFALNTGLRQANVLGLQWSQIDLTRACAWIHADEAKGRRPIAVPLNAEALAALGRQRGKHPDSVFTFRGEPIKQINTKAPSSAPASATFAGMTCATPGPVGTSRTGHRSTPCRKWAPGRPKRWCTGTPICPPLTWPRTRPISPS